MQAIKNMAKAKIKFSIFSSYPPSTVLFGEKITTLGSMEYAVPPAEVSQPNSSLKKIFYW